MSRHRVSFLATLLLVAAIAAALLRVPAPRVSAGINDLTQLDYRWYQNADAVQPTTALAAQNTAITGVTDAQVLRIRMNVRNTVSTLSAGAVFKLQYSTSTGGPWTDVGAIGSGATWRGYNNPTPADGATLSSALLSSSFNNARQTYEEANNATTVNSVAANRAAEWDWVLQANQPQESTTYYFRMAKSDGSALAGYTNYPQLTMAAASLTQNSYRFYQNADAIQPTTALAAESTAITGVTDGSAVRIRLSVAGSQAVLPAGATFKLQYSTSTGGPWTDVGALGSGVIWRGYDNSTPADGAAISANLLSGATILETYEEANDSAAMPNAITAGNSAEWDWVVQDNGALSGTTYYFRMVRSSGAALGGYTAYPQLTTASASLTQQDYRWYQNADAIQPTTPLAAENTGTTASSSGDLLRLRMNVESAVARLDTGATFKLQYSTATGGPWTEVGAIGSGVIWRGYDNTTPADGATLSATLLSTSSVVETYEEANSSAATPNAINAGQRGEWDWVVQSNGASPGTTYYFRMVRGDDTSLEGYTNYSQVAVTGATLSQEDYRWYQNADAVQPTVALAAENTALSAATDGTVYRIRTNVAVSGAQLASGQTFKLQYSTSAGGPWTDVGAIGSGVIWRGYNNATPADGATLSATLLSTSNVVETYEEANISAATPNTVNVGQRGEWDWVVQNNGAAGSTTYYFRIVMGDDTALSAYTTYPTLATATPALIQDHYRWYQNADAIQPTTSLAAEDTATTGVGSGTVLRVRLSAQGSTYTTAAGQTFKLQYSTSTGGPWTDVGGIGSAESWRGYDNATPADGAAITANLLSTATVLETYEEANNSAATPNAIAVGSSAEWDWVVENNGASPSTTFYFQMVYSDGSALSSYAAYPQLTTAASAETLTQLDYRWYQNADAIQPTTPLAAEDTFVAGSARSTVYHLRMNVNVTGANLAAGTTFKLQFATSTGGPWTDVGDIGSAEAWRGYDNPTPADGATLSSALLSSSFNGARQTYEEQNNATSSGIAKNRAGEWGWVVQNNVAAQGTTYYFRMVRGDGAALDAYTNYPEIATPGLTLTPNNSGSSTPETVLSYTHTVTNTGRSSDTFDITTASSAGWSVALYQSDGVNPLTDTDTDTIPDTGSLAPSASVNIVVKVTIGWSALSDTTTVTGASSADTLVSAAATETTTAPPTITVSVVDVTANFGTNLDPSGLDSNSPDTVLDYQGASGNQGTYYVWKAGGSGLAVTVKSNKPWSGTVVATENSGTSPSMTIASGVLRYSEGTEPASYAACAAATAFTAAPAPWKSGVPAGVYTYTDYYCIRVDWDDDPGTFSSTVTYTTAQD